MANKFRPTSWFTLVEMVIAITMLAILATAMIDMVLFMEKHSVEIEAKANSVAEASVANSLLSNILKNSYGIDYDETVVSEDDGKIVVYGDKLEKDKTSVWLQKDPSSDVSRLVASRNGWPPFALHSSSFHVDKFSVSISRNPKSDPSSLEDQPWVSFSMTGRRRSPLEIPTEDSYYPYYEKAKVRIDGRMVLRNYVPSSLKE